MKMKSVINLILTTILTGALLVGCSTTPTTSITKDTDKKETVNTEDVSTTKTEDTNKKIKIGATLQDLGNVYFIDYAEGLKARADELGYELTITDGKSDAQAQINSIENFILSKVDAIIIAPYDAASLEPYVQQAKDKGIKVICSNQKVDGYDAFIGLDELEYGLAGGRLAGNWIKDNFDANEEVEVGLITYPEMETIIDRGRGLKEGILSIAPNAKIVNEQSAATPEKGEQVTSAMLQANPNIKVIACINDSSALGALNAVMSAGKNSDDFCIVGLDATEEAIAKIKEGSVLRATVDIAPRVMGANVIDLVTKVINEGPQTETVPVQMIDVTKDNIDKY